MISQQGAVPSSLHDHVPQLHSHPIQTWQSSPTSNDSPSKRWGCSQNLYKPFCQKGSTCWETSGPVEIWEFQETCEKKCHVIQFNLLGFFGGTRDSNQSQFQHYLQHSPTLLPPLPFRSISHEMTIPLTTFMIMKVSHWKNFRNKGKWVQWSMTLQWASHGLSSRVIRIETENVWILVASRDWVRTKRACFFERLKDHRLQPWISN